MAQHVYPLDDEITHVCSAMCPCVPSPKQNGTKVIWIHHAQDCRELIEQAEQIRLYVSAELVGQWKESGKPKAECYPFSQDKAIWPVFSKR